METLGTHFREIVSAVPVSSGPPTIDVHNGDLWFDSDVNKFNVYYDGHWRAWGEMTTSTSTSTSTSSTSTSTT